MKKILSAIVFLPLLSLNSAMAQPTLTGAGCNPVANDKFYRYDLDVSALSKGASGAAATWDFSHVVVNYTDSLTFIACSSTLYCDSFPGSNLAVAYGTSGYEYYIADSTKLAIHGDVSSGFVNRFSDPQSLLAYPITYNNVKLDSFFDHNFSASYISHGTDSIIADAYGTLILPYDTFTNVLRVHFISNVTDSSTVSTMVDHYQDDLYMWLSPVNHFPLLIMGYDTTGAGADISFAAYYKKKGYVRYTNAVDDIHTSLALQVSPNPATDFLNVKFYTANSSETAVVLYDIMGKVAATVDTRNLQSGQNETQLPVQSLAPGSYILKIQTVAGVETRKVEIVR